MKARHSAVRRRLVLTATFDTNVWDSEHRTEAEIEAAVLAQLVEDAYGNPVGLKTYKIDWDWKSVWVDKEEQ